jgi:protein-tyrosine phosphatase
MTVRICFVCLGNICRSPTAEATMRRLIETAQLSGRIEIDSAGTGDCRARAAGRRRGIDVRGRARTVRAEDFDQFDYLIAMDRSNLQDLHRLAPHEEGRTKIALLRSFDPRSPRDAEVPDPYYGEGNGFETVLDICEAACAALLQRLREAHRL